MRDERNESGSHLRPNLITTVHTLEYVRPLAQAGKTHIAAYPDTNRSASCASDQFSMQ